MELTNSQRQYFGLQPVQEHWERMEARGGYLLFFDHNTIVKIIISSDTMYREYDTHEQTNNRQTILPKTGKGKEKKLNYTGISGIRGTGTFFSADYADEGFLKVVNLQTEISFINRYEHEMPVRNDAELQQWIENFISHSPEDHFEWVTAQITAPRQNIKNILPGQIFARKTGRFEYSFARVICYLPQLKKDGILGEGRHGLHHVMGKSMLVKPYTFTGNSPETDLDALIASPSLPSTYVMDNHVFYGENPVIGRRPLQEHDLDFPISFGKTPAQEPHHYLQWGFGHTEKEHNDTRWAISGKSGDRHMGFRNDGVGFEITTSDYQWKTDLRNPAIKDIRGEAFAAMGFAPDISYNDFCIQTGALSVEEQLRYLNK